MQAKVVLLVLLGACGQAPEPPSSDVRESLRDSGEGSRSPDSSDSGEVPTESASGAPPQPAPSSPANAGKAPFRFADASAGSGLEFVNVSGSRDQDYVLESMSTAAAFADYDGDGFLDLFAVNGTRLTGTAEGAGNRLFRNEPDPKEGSGSARRFREVEAGLGPSGWGMGCAAGDYDNDGDVDFHVTYWGPNRLYRNDGGDFAEVAASAGVADRGWGSSAAFADLDADGLLDLYVTNYLEFDLERPPGGGGKCLYKGLNVFCGPAYAPRQRDRLYRNEGGGTFADVSAAAGVEAHRLPGLGVVFGDFDGDADQDIYVANDGEPNLLFRNDGGWRFAEIARTAGAAYSLDGMAQASMGVHAGDFDNDGDLDLFTTNFSDEYNTLYRNGGGGSFEDATGEAGLGENALPFLGWGTGFVDFDNDGWLDLFVANGHLHPELDRSFLGLFYAQRNLLYHNRGGRFVEVGAGSGGVWSIEKVSRAAAVGDYDNDGDADLFVMNLNDTPTLLRNDSGGGSGWLGLRLTGTESNRDAIGARVKVRGGGMEQVREVQRGYSFQAQNDPRLLFGLGGGKVGEVEILWPSGRRQLIADPPPGRYLKVREP
ncbi:MAG: CRTAC1 family protein [Gemmatimonadetes bacterium]|nr:CRTAC1 family protein [Gemmatimonadota bacterium]